MKLVVRRENARQRSIETHVGTWFHAFGGDTTRLTLEATDKLHACSSVSECKRIDRRERGNVNDSPSSKAQRRAR